LFKLEFVIDYFEGEIKNIKIVVTGPNSTPSVGMVKTERGLVCHFTPAEPGTHEVRFFLGKLTTFNELTLFIFSS
jgi:hypothetical protein